MLVCVFKRNFSLSIIHSYTGDPDARNVIFMAVDAVLLKLLTIWTSQPEVWFAQTKVQFNLRSIVADETKYYYVIAALNQETVSRLLDLTGQPPDTEKHQTLKDHLLNTLGLNR